MTDTGLWTKLRRDYLGYLKQAIAGLNTGGDERHLPRLLTDVYARLIRTRMPPADVDMVALVLDCEEALAYDVVISETLDDGTWLRLRRSEIKVFIEIFSQSIRACHMFFGDDFVRYARRFQLTDCYRPQDWREEQSEYDDAWLAAWVRFIELADAYGEPLAAQRVIQRLELLVNA